MAHVRVTKCSRSQTYASSFSTIKLSKKRIEVGGLPGFAIVSRMHRWFMSPVIKAMPTRSARAEMAPTTTYRNRSHSSDSVTCCNRFCEARSEPELHKISLTRTSSHSPVAAIVDGGPTACFKNRPQPAGPPFRLVHSYGTDRFAARLKRPLNQRGTHSWLPRRQTVADGCSY
jgi:hypothetical protein